MYSIGLDVSKSSINIFVPNGSLDLKIENTPKALKSFYSKLKKIYKREIDKLVFVFESTGSYSALLYHFCEQKSIKVFMVNPKQSRNFAKAIAQRNKSDVIDARVLSQAIVIAKELEIHIPTIDPLVEEIKELMTYYKLKVKQRVQLSNHLEALKAKMGNKALIKSIESELKVLHKQEEKIIDTIYTIIEKDDILYEKYTYITSIRGIGKIVGIVLLHLFLKYPDANQRQIVSLAGLDPIMKESGTSIKGKSRISKAGGSLYRGILFMATLSSIQHNEYMKLFYDRLKQNGKHSTVAQIAVMRKLIIIAHSLYKNNQCFDKEKYQLYVGASNRY